MLMNQLPETNRHILGGSALAVAILGLGIAASIRSTEPVSSITTAQTTAQTEKWVNPANQPWADPSSSNFVLQLSQVPSNAYGSAQPAEPGGPNALNGNQTAASVSSKPTAKVAGAAGEAKNWTDREWEIASKAVAAYRMAGRAAQALVPNSSSESVWLPPEEIANGNASGETR
jgi:hypothetical protein